MTDREIHNQMLIGLIVSRIEAQHAWDNPVNRSEIAHEAAKDLWAYETPALRDLIRKEIELGTGGL